MFFPLNLTMGLLTPKTDNPFFFAALYTAVSVLWSAAFQLLGGFSFGVLIGILGWGVLTLILSSVWFYLLTATGGEGKFFWIILLIGCLIV